MSDVKTDLGLVVLEHLDFDIMCEAMTPCDHAAVWLCTFTCCGEERLGCEPHRAHTVELIEQGFRHTVCGAKKTGMSAVPLPKGQHHG